MDKQNVSEKLKEILVDKLGLDPEEVTNDALLKNDLGMDSLDTIEIIMELEKEYTIAIPDEFYDEVKTVDDAVEYIFKIIA